MIFVPIVVALGGVGAYEAYEWFKRRSKSKIGPGMGNKPSLNGIDQSKLPKTAAGDVDAVKLAAQAGHKPFVVAPPITVGKTPAGHPIVAVAPTIDGQSTLAAKAVSGKALVNSLAATLVDQLSAGAADPNTIKAFQAAVNADTNAQKLNNIALDLNGIFDLPTAASLSTYTGASFPADTQGQMFAMLSPAMLNAPVGSPGAAAMSGLMLYHYLKQHGNDKTAILKALTGQFQNDVNTDFRYPGPAAKLPYAAPTLALIKSKLVVDGSYGPRSADALAVTSFERIAP